MRRCRGSRRVFVATVGITLACAGLVAGPFAARVVAQGTSVAGEWSPPVAGRVLRPFAEPIATYAAGHRGVDFAAPPGTPARAANDGTVAFAGDVAGSLHVVIAHAGGIRTSYSFLSRVDMRVGQVVRRGQVVGAAGGVGDGHGVGVLHFGVRIGERYVDPMVLFRPRDLTQLVRLVPADQRDARSTLDPAGEAAALFAWMGEPNADDGSCGALIGDVASDLGFGDEASSVCAAVGDAVEAGLDLLGSLGPEAQRLVEAIAPVVRAVVGRMVALGESLAEAATAVAAEAAEQVERVVRALVALAIAQYEWLTSCPQPDPVAHPVGSGNFVMAVAGQGSARKRRADGTLGRSLSIDWRVLGYRHGDVTSFSYSAHSATYGKAATYGDLHEKARLLGEQLKAAASAQPGRHVDLIGHSQGGVVIDLFLREVYPGHEREYPPIDNVVTFASPHEGTPTAKLAATVAGSPADAIVTPVVAAKAHIPLGSDAFEQLSPESETIHNVWSGPEPPRPIRKLSVMGSADPWVPSSSGDIPGGTKVVVPVGVPYLPDDHTEILHDSDAVSAAQAHLSGGSPADSCGPLVDVPGAVYGAAVSAGADLISGIPPYEPATPVPGYSIAEGGGIP